MAEVKWIKMIVGMFDGMSFKKIKRAKIGGESYRDKLTAVWFELMDLAGKCNHDGALVNTGGIPFTDLDDIAIQIDRDEEELKLCMAFYLKERMISIEDNVYAISNWSVYQNVEGMEKLREQTRQRVAKCRERKKLQAPATDGNATCNVTVTDGNALEEEGEEDKELDKDIEIERKNESSFDQPNDSDFNSFSTGFSTFVDKREAQKRQLMQGELGKGVVFLSQEQMDDLLDKLSIEEFDHYVGVVADCILSGKQYKRKTHYQAILDMAAADRRIK